MCVKPTYIFREKGPQYEKLAVPCRQCWACLKNKQAELSTKAVLELQSSDWSAFLTLTYDDKKLRTGDEASYLHTADFTRFMKRMRKRMEMRYLVAGEYGARKGRAHFHCILFGKGAPPEIAYNKKYWIFDPWPHGFTWADKTTYRNIEYVTKYLTKGKTEKAAQSEDFRQEWVSYSRIPPLGIEKVYQLAEWYAEEKVVPRSFRINPGVTWKKVRFQISGSSQHLFLDHLVHLWPEVVLLPKTEWMENAFRRWAVWHAHKNPALIDWSNYARPRWADQQTGLTVAEEVWQEFIRANSARLRREAEERAIWRARGEQTSGGALS